MRISKNWQLVLLYIIVAVAFRAVSFFTSVLDHDESTYMIIGRDILHDKLLYFDTVDSKSPGIFIIYAFLQLIFGYSIVLKRIFASIVVGLTAYFLNVASEKLFQNKNAAIATGFIYILFTSIWNQTGLSPNTELYFNLFTTLGLIFFLKRSTLSYFIAGFLLGTGFIIKNVVLFDFVAIAAFFLFYELTQRKWKITGSHIRSYVLSGIGFSIPFIIVNLYFYMDGRFQEFSFFAYEMPGRYIDRGALWPYIKMLFDFTLRFLPICFLVFYVLFSKKSLLVGWPKFLLIFWLTSTLIAIYLPGRGFSHYAIQLMLPASLIAGVAFHIDFVFDRFTRFVYHGKTGFALLVVLVAAIQVSAIVAKIKSIDKAEEIADYLQEKLKKHDVIYVGNYEQVVYYLLKLDSPTKYIHGTIMSSPALSYVFNINPQREIEKVLAKRPRFILVKPPFMIENMIKVDYYIDTLFYNGEVEVHELIDEDTTRVDNGETVEQPIGN